MRKQWLKTQHDSRPWRCVSMLLCIETFILEKCWDSAFALSTCYLLVPPLLFTGVFINFCSCLWGRKVQSHMRPLMFSPSLVFASLAFFKAIGLVLCELSYHNHHSLAQECRRRASVQCLWPVHEASWGKQQLLSSSFSFTRSWPSGEMLIKIYGRPYPTLLKKSQRNKNAFLACLFYVFAVVSRAKRYRGMSTEKWHCSLSHPPHIMFQQSYTEYKTEVISCCYCRASYNANDKKKRNYSPF